MGFAVFIDVYGLYSNFFDSGICVQRFNQHICFVFEVFACQSQIVFNQAVWYGPLACLGI